SRTVIVPSPIVAKLVCLLSVKPQLELSDPDDAPFSVLLSLLWHKPSFQLKNNFISVHLSFNIP
ncbi:MAG TPA: hypothetical protein PKG60_13735, partial [Spirochaetota bacterium]|nr:hypothetical protein [Spirochaetota bacterium]